MPDAIFKAIYLLGLLFEMAIRAPLNRQRRQIASSQPFAYLYFEDTLTLTASYLEIQICKWL